MRQLEEEVQIQLSEALSIQKAVMYTLSYNFDKSVANNIYQEFQDIATAYRRERHDMVDLFKQSQLRYFKAINESIGFALEIIKGRYL